MKKEKKFCQRCGYPKYDKKYKAGTNKDNSKSLLYCERCLIKGDFFHPEMNRQEMMIMIIDLSKEAGWFVGKTMNFLFPKQIKKLSYWSKDNTIINKKYSKEDSEKNYLKYKDYYAKY